MSSTTRVVVCCAGISARPSASPSHKCRFGSIAFVLVGLLLIADGQAQITDVTNVTSTPIQGAGHDYIKLFAETVSQSNGSVSLRIQVPTPPGRRLSLPFAFAYDSNGAHHVESNGRGALLWWDNTAALATGGWSYSLPMLSNVLVDIPGGIGPDCVYYNNYVFEDESGGRHSLYLALVPTPTSCPGKTSKLVGGDDHYQAVLTTNQDNPLPIADADGAVYTFPCCNLPYVGGGGQVNSQSQSGLPSLIEDRNGNIISIADHGAGAFTVTDTVGRMMMLSSSGFGSSGNTVTASGLGSSYTLTWGPASSNYAVGSSLVYTDGYCAGGIHDDVQTLNVITKITLPNNDTYNFSYDSKYGVVSKITYPNGAYVRYTYALNTLSEHALFEDEFGRNTCILHHDTLAVAHRYVSFDGVNEVLQQDFSYSTTWATSYPYTWTSKNTTVTTTDKVTSQSFTTSYTYSPKTLPRQPNDTTQFGGQVPVENTIVYKDTTGTTLRTVTKTWHDQYEIGSEQTALENGQTSKTAYTFGPGAQITERDDYDYGSGAPGSLLRQIKTTYQSFPSTPIFPSKASIYDRPCKVVTYDGSSNQLAETDYTYDGGTTVCGTAGTQSVQDVTGLPAGTHDEINYPATLTPPRGNVTTKTQWMSTGTSPVTTYTYDKTGQVLTVKDPCGNATCSDMTGSNHTTLYSYADSYTVLSGGQNISYTPTANTNAYMSQVTDPLTHTANFTYDYNNAQLTVSKDSNLQSATYIYNDAFARPTQMNYPDGGQTSFSYDDSTYSQTNNTPNVQTTKAIASGTNLTTKTAMDGMGHVVRLLLTSDPAGTDTTDTSYDGPGRLRTQSNPHRSGSSSTDGTATHNYDPLGRPTTTAQQDGSTVTTTYSGNCTTVTDEAGKSRKSCSDGLGRLTQVIEDPNTLAYETDYTYDALGNLLTVNQKGNDPNSANWRPRTFTYDWLSRLVCAANPEIHAVTCPTSATGTFPFGATLYTYDSNGNVSTKSAPSPNQPTTGTATVTATYTYDPLNRLTGKSYADSYNPATPTVTYGYDGANLSCPTPVGFYGQSATNGIGRRTAMCFNAGSKSWTYDPMGRISGENDRFIWLVPPYSADVYTLNGVSTLSTDTSYAYYLNGDLFDVFYPMPHGPPDYEFATTENAAGQVTAAGDIYYHVLQNATYAPTGQLATALVGWSDGTPAYNGTSISKTYNKRLQPVLVSATTPSNATVFNLTYNFNLGNGTTGSDNGNVIQIANGKDGNRTQNFLYDSLNRIQQAYTSGPNWGETYSPTATAPGVPPSTPGIDAWGNLTNRSGVTGKTNTEPLSCSANTQNQLNTCYTYDAVGNLITNGNAAYTYDDENRLIATGGMSYVYDGDGQRVEKCTEGATPGTCASNATGTFYFLHAGGGTLAESDLSGNWTAAYGLIRGQVASRVDLPANVVHYYFHDHLNSTNVITGNLGNVVEEEDFYPYGGEIVISSGDSNRYKFTGKERDTESGLDDFDSRYFGSSMGRFMSPDDDSAQEPNDPQSWNLYSYVGNNPLSRTDPDGHSVSICDTNGQNCQKISDDAYAKAQQQDTYNHAGSLDQLKDSGLLSNITDSNGTVVGTVQYVPDDPKGAPVEGITPGLLGPVDLVLLSGVKTPSVVTDFFGKLFGSILGKGAGDAAETAAKQLVADVDNLSNKIVRQMATRGWTKQEILDTVNAGKAFPVVNKATGGAATEYVSASGKFVVVDNATKQVIQVSGPGFLPNH